MAAKRPVEFKARDGLALRGYVTVPKGAEDRRLPMDVMTHGGPYGVQDTCDFDPHVQMLAAAGFGGTALLFDEVDRNLSFSSKRTQIIGDNLRQVVDLCGRHKLPRTLFVYAVPPEFMRSVVPDYPALYQRLKSPARLGVRNARSVVIDLDDLDLPPSKLLAAIAEKIFDVFDTVHPGALSADCQRRNGRLLAAACVSTQFDVNHRRLFVKTFIDFLQHQRETGEIELTDDAAIDIVLDEFEGLHA